MRSLAIFCLSLLGLVALAEGPPLATQAARAHYQAGRIYYESGDIRRALAEFIAARVDDDRAALDYDIGVCHERLGDAVRAVEAYERFLARELQSTSRAEVEQRLAGLPPLIGELSIISRVPGARLELDGQSVPALTPLKVNVGTRTVRASKEGYRSRTGTVIVLGGGRAAIEIDPLAIDVNASRRRALAIGLGLAGGVVAVGAALALGLGLTLGRPRLEDGPTELGTIVVRP